MSRHERLALPDRFTDRDDPPEELRNRLITALDALICDRESSQVLANVVLPLFADEHERARQAEEAEFTAEKRAERTEAAIAEVRRLQEMTIAVSCRAYAIEQAEDTLAVLDRFALDVPPPAAPRRRTEQEGGPPNDAYVAGDYPKGM